MLSSTIIYLLKHAKSSYKSISINIVQDSTCVIVHNANPFIIILSNYTYANWFIWICLLKLCKLLEGWLFGLSQLSHRLPLSNIHITLESLSWMAQNNSCSDVYSSSSSLVDSSSSSLVYLLSLWALTSFFLSMDSSFTTMYESTISWTCSLFTCPSFLSVIFQTFMYLTLCS